MMATCWEYGRDHVCYEHLDDPCRRHQLPIQQHLQRVFSRAPSPKFVEHDQNDVTHSFSIQWNPCSPCSHTFSSSKSISHFQSNLYNLNSPLHVTYQQLLEHSTEAAFETQSPNLYTINQEHVTKVNDFEDCHPWIWRGWFHNRLLADPKPCGWRDPTCRS